MSRIATTFERKSRNVLNVYCTAGYPMLDSTVPVMRAIQDSGADIIELGMPYSDPLADGPVIQASSGVALQNGMTLEVLFSQLKDMRKEIEIPVILMGYMNPVLQYGIERFCAKAAEVGVDGLILPDLPEYEFETEYGPIIHKYELDAIFLVTPETSEARVRKLDGLSSGFLYAVSSSSITGSDKNMDAVGSYLQRLKGYGLKNPILVGFGIRDRQSFEQASASANGAIIGTAFIQALSTAKDPMAAIPAFIQHIIG